MIEKNFSQLTLDRCKKEFISVMDSLSYSHNRWQVFCDFVEMSAIAISNTSDMIHYEEREARYKEIMSGYSKMDADKFVDLLSLVMAACRRCEDNPRDILGELFHQMNLQNEWKGQFFTPSHLCSFMAELQMGDIDDKLNEKGYVTVSDPCCGAGAMIIGFADAMCKHKYDYTKMMRATATDIDIRCVHMAFIQISLYGIPAVVIHGDSLALTEWSHWYTPSMCSVLNKKATEQKEQPLEAITA